LIKKKGATHSLE